MTRKVTSEMAYNCMKILTKNAAAGLTLCLLMTAAAGAVAQEHRPRLRTPQPAAAKHLPTMAQATPAELPQRTTATYGNWVLQCETPATQPRHEVCDIAQVTQLKGKNVPFSRIAVVHAGKGKPFTLMVQVPVNVSFKTEVRIQTGNGDPGLMAPFARCTPSGCFAEFDLKNDVLKKLRAAAKVGKFSFADSGGHDVTIPISFEGFSQAFDALAKK